MRAGRLIPVSMLKRRLDLNRFDFPAPFRELDPLPEQIVVQHRQHAGAPGRGVLTSGQQVAQNQVLAEVPPEELGVPVHAPFSGKVAEVKPEATVILRGH
jgi:Na+-translocating ferredoxin:NAD+ oxidoreductase RnfC subunit